EGLARAREQDHRVGGLALERAQQCVAILESQRGQIERVPAARADPALLRQDHGDRLLEHGALDLRALRALYQGPSLVPVFLRIRVELLDDELLQLLLIAKQRLEILALGFERFSLVVELRAVELGELPQAKIDDVLSLLFRKFKSLS